MEAKDFFQCLDRTFAARALVVAPFFNLVLKSLKSPFLLDVGMLIFESNFKQGFL